MLAVETLWLLCFRLNRTSKTVENQQFDCKQNFSATCRILTTLRKFDSCSVFPYQITRARLPRRLMKSLRMSIKHDITSKGKSL